MWEVVGTDVFIINNENVLCIVEYYSKLPVIKKVESLLAIDLIQATKVVFADVWLTQKMMSDAGINFVSE